MSRGMTNPEACDRINSQVEECRAVHQAFPRTLAFESGHANFFWILLFFSILVSACHHLNSVFFREKIHGRNGDSSFHGPKITHCINANIGNHVLADSSLSFKPSVDEIGPLSSEFLTSSLKSRRLLNFEEQMLNEESSTVQDPNQTQRHISASQFLTNTHHQSKTRDQDSSGQRKLRPEQFTAPIQDFRIALTPSTRIYAPSQPPRLRKATAIGYSTGKNRRKKSSEGMSYKALGSSNSSSPQSLQKRLKMVSKLFRVLPRMEETVVKLLEPSDIPSILDAMEKMETSNNSGEHGKPDAKTQKNLTESGSLSNSDSRAPQKSDENNEHGKNEGKGNAAITAIHNLSKSLEEADSSARENGLPTTKASGILGIGDTPNGCQDGSCKCRNWIGLSGWPHVREASRICDGFCDCPPCDDELGCSVEFVEGNPIFLPQCSGLRPCHQCEREQWSCAEPGIPDKGCFSRSQECDDIVHCRMSGKDEKGCLKLDIPESGTQTLAPLLPEGFMHRKMQGTWHLICGSSSVSQNRLPVQVCLDTVGSFSKGPQLVSNVPPVKAPGMRFASFLNGHWTLQDECTTFVTKVVCFPPPCGATFREDVPLKKKRSHARTYRNSSAIKRGDDPRNKLQSVIKDTISRNDDDEINSQEDRIVGGVASRLAHPWLALVRIVKPWGSRSFCSGTIIAAEWIMTAAHCYFRRSADGGVERYQEYHYEASAGLLRATSASLSTQIRKGIRVILHEAFSAITTPPGVFHPKINDIALMKVDRPFIFNRHVNALCLPPMNERPPASFPCTVAGWGTLWEHGVTADHLQEVALPIWEPCDALDYVVKNSDRQLCAGLRKGGKDSCQGDSGAPLVCRYKGALVATGVVSHGRGCARQNAPGVYTRVASYVEWIDRIIRRYLDHEFDANEDFKIGGCPGMTCDDGRCVLYSEICDGIHHCPGHGEDETATGCRLKKRRTFPYL